MALSASTVLEVRNVADFSGASDTNGGGFVTGASGTDYSFASIPALGAAKYALTNGATAGTTTILTSSASADMVGNIAYVAGGTGSVVGNWYQIVSQTTGVSIVVDRSTGLTTGTGVTINIGGCLATPGLAAALMTVAGMYGWVRYSTTAYTLTTATPGSGGPVSFANVFPLTFQGYQAARGDRTGSMPSIAWPSSGLSTGSTTYMVNASHSIPIFVGNITCNGNGIANVYGFTGLQYAVFQGCIAQNFSNTGCIGFNGVLFDSCEANACTIGFQFAGGCCLKCVAISCTNTGFYANTTAVPVSITKCISYSCAIGFICSNGIYSECTADSCTTYGFRNVQAYAVLYDSCIASNNTGGGVVGFSGATGTGDVLLNCAVYNNATNYSATITNIINLATLTAQPYVTAGSQFAPNTTAGGGAALRGAGVGVFGQTDNQDIGAVQHADPSGGGNTYIFQTES